MRKSSVALAKGIKGRVWKETKGKRCHLGLGHLRGGGAAGAGAHFNGQVGHTASLLYELVEAAQPAQLHHNGQSHSTHVCLYGLQTNAFELVKFCRLDAS